MSRIFNVFATNPACVALLGFTLVLQTTSPAQNTISGLSLDGQASAPTPSTGSALLPSLPLPGERQHTTAISVRNVKASYLAWQLDPAHNATPIEVQASLRNRTSLFMPPQGAAEKTPEPAPLPVGIEQIIPVDPQNILLVIGTNEGVPQLTQRVAELDRPMRQVEIEATFVRVSPENVRLFTQGQTPASANGVGTEELQGVLAMGTSGNAQAVLSKLISEKKAQVITSPRVLAINGLTASLGMQSPNAEPAGLKDAPDVKAATGFQFTATPTVSKDETITVAVALAKTLQLSQENSTGVFPLQALDVLSTSLAFKDGQTFVLTAPEGRLSSLMGGLGAKPSKASNVVVLLKASLVRHFGDEDHIPGT